MKEKETALAERAAEFRLWRADFRERDLEFRRSKAASSQTPREAPDLNEK